MFKPPRIGRRRILPWTGFGTLSFARLDKHAAEVSFPEDQHPDEHADFDPRKHYSLTLASHELTDVGLARAATAAASVSVT
jgi:hypothetical protein